MKRAAFLPFMVVLLIGYGLSQGPVTFVTPAYAEGQEKKKAEADPNAPHPEFEYIQLDPINLPIITVKGPSQQLSLLVSLEIPYGKKEEVEGFKPRLNDAYIQDLYGALGAGHALMRNNIVDVPQIKQRLTSVTGRVLGPELKIHDVLLQVLQQRPL